MNTHPVPDADRARRRTARANPWGAPTLLVLGVALVAAAAETHVVWCSLPGFACLAVFPTVIKAEVTARHVVRYAVATAGDDDCGCEDKAKCTTCPLVGR